jgi:hypothetical protein
MQEPLNETRFSLKQLFGYVTATCVIIGMGGWLFDLLSLSVFPISTLNRLRQGMTEAQVTEILGEPSHTRFEGDPQDPSETWVYESAWNPGYVDVYFDDDRLYSSFNDESVEPAR